MEDSWGKRLSMRSVWVPLPTPGAPTKMMRAALRSWTVGGLMLPVYDGGRAGSEGWYMYG